MILSSIIDYPYFFEILWIVVFILAIVIELMTEQLVSIWFSGGALIAVVLALFNVEWQFQLLVFVVVSAILVVLSRYVFFKKEKNQNSLKTNVDMMIGKKILVISKVDKENPGEGKYRDIIWTIISEDEINVGNYAIIKRIDGNKLIVDKINNF